MRWIWWQPRDENVDAPIVATLRAAGHRIVYVREVDPEIDDDQVLDLANRNGAFLLTSDKDFGELVFRQGLVHAAVICIASPVSAASERPPPY